MFLSLVEVENDGERGGATERGGMPDATKGDQVEGLKEAEKCSSVHRPVANRRPRCAETTGRCSQNDHFRDIRGFRTWYERAVRISMGVVVAVRFRIVSFLSVPVSFYLPRPSGLGCGVEKTVHSVSAPLYCMYL
jgi:hypothetical protein